MQALLDHIREVPQGMYSSAKTKSYRKFWIRLMNYKSVFSLFILFFCVTGLHFLSAQTPEFDKLKAKFEQGKVFEAQFNHEFTDSYTGEILVSDGKIWIGANAYRLESEGQDLVVDGETSKVYDSSRNRVIIDDYIPEDDDFAPSRLLQGLDY